MHFNITKRDFPLFCGTRPMTNIDPRDRGELALDVGRRLTLLRDVYEMSQTAFGKISGLSQSRYSQYETGERLLPVPVAIAFADQFGVSLDWLYMGDPSAMPLDLWRKIQNLADARDPK